MKRMLTRVPAVIAAVFILQGYACAASDLYLSEYIEGSSYNKRL